MQFTVTLTQQQVQDLLTQVNGNGVKVARPRQNRKILPQTIKMRTMIDKLAKDSFISATNLQIRTNATSSQVSSVLKQYRRDGKLEMVKRGLWKVVA